MVSQVSFVSCWARAQIFIRNLLQVATLEVVIPPQISDKHSTEDLSVAEGNSAKFICSATGHPQPQIIWQKVPKSSREKARIRILDKNGREIVQKRIHGEVLELPKVSRQDMGTYLCIAKNNVPPAVSKNFKLTVNCKLHVNQVRRTNTKYLLPF